MSGSGSRQKFPEKKRKISRALGGRAVWGVKAVHGTTLPLVLLGRDRAPLCCLLTPGLCPAWHGLQVCLPCWITTRGQGQSHPGPRTKDIAGMGFVGGYINREESPFFPAPTKLPFGLRPQALPPFPPVSAGLAS